MLPLSIVSFVSAWLWLVCHVEAPVFAQGTDKEPASHSNADDDGHKYELVVELAVIH